MQDDGAVQLLPHIADGGPPEPEYALPDGPAVLYYVVRRLNHRDTETQRRPEG